MNLYWQIKPGIYTSATFVTTNYLIHSKFWKKIFDHNFELQEFVGNLFDKLNYEKKICMKYRK